MLLGLWLSLSMAFAETTSDISIGQRDGLFLLCSRRRKRSSLVKTLCKKS